MYSCIISLPLSWSEGSVSERRGDVGDTAITWEAGGKVTVHIHVGTLMDLQHIRNTLNFQQNIILLVMSYIQNILYNHIFNLHRTEMPFNVFANIADSDQTTLVRVTWSWSTMFSYENIIYLFLH